MICDNCGYENKDDALSCNLCGKVFRKEVREDEKGDENKFEGKNRIYWDRNKKNNIIGLIFIMVFIMPVVIIMAIAQTQKTFWDMFVVISFIVGFIGVCIWVCLTETQEDKKREKEKVLHPFKSTIETLKSKGREKREAIVIICSFIIAWIIYDMMLTKRFSGLKKTLHVPGGYSPYEGFLIILISFFVFVLLSKIYDGISWLFNKIKQDKGVKEYE